MKSEIQLLKDEIVVTTEITTPFGKKMTEYTFSYEEFRDLGLTIDIYDIYPYVDGETLKGIIIQGDVKKERNVKVELTQKTRDLPPKLYESCILKYIPSIRRDSESFGDLVFIISYIIKNIEKYSLYGITEDIIKKLRNEATRNRAKNKGVTYQTVHSNITRTLKLTTDQLDDILVQIIDCIMDIQNDKFKGM